ncbi:hypothetical protein ABPG77_003993 [Micractinium sp. CCAP 211/92]
MAASGLEGELASEQQLPLPAPAGEGWRPPSTPLEELFDSLDQNKDGKVDVQEAKAALKQLGLPAGPSYISALLDQYDLDGTRSIEFEEFRRYVESKQGRMRAIFSRLDLDGDGRLDAREVHHAAAALGLAVAEGDAEHMVALLDSDGDGMLSFQEFQRYMVLLPSSQMGHARVLAAWIDSTSWIDSMEYHLGHVPPTEPLERLLAGGVAGAVSRTAVAPLERLRTIMMADPAASRLGPVLRAMWADGTRGLFRGNLATVMKVFPSSAIQFATYDACKDVMMHLAGPGTQDLSTLQKAGAGLVSGAVACTFTYPLEALRTQVAVTQGAAGASYRSIVRDMVAGRGLRGLFQGYPSALVSNSFSYALGFGSYEFLCTAYAGWRGAPPSPGEKGLLGGCASFATMGLTMPMENVVKRLQAQGRPGFPQRYSGGLDCAAQMLRQEGARAFWRGTVSSLARVVPAIAATRLLYETIVDTRGIGGVRRYRADSD